MSEPFCFSHLHKQLLASSSEKCLLSLSSLSELKARPLFFSSFCNFFVLNHRKKGANYREESCLHQASAERWTWWNCWFSYWSFLKYIFLMFLFFVCVFVCVNFLAKSLSFLFIRLLLLSQTGWWVITRWRWSMMACKSSMCISMDLLTVNLQYPHNLLFFGFYFHGFPKMFVPEWKFEFIRWLLFWVFSILTILIWFGYLTIYTCHICYSLGPFLVQNWIWMFGVLIIWLTFSPWSTVDSWYWVLCFDEKPTLVFMHYFASMFVFGQSKKTIGLPQRFVCWFIVLIGSLNSCLLTDWS